MNCLKCGRETSADDVFCQDCLSEMAKHPVNPGTVVLLPRRKETPAPKKAPKRHVFSLEEQVASLRKWVISLLLMLMLCLIAIVLMIKPTLHYALDEHFEIGQNYSSVTTDASEGTSDTAEQTDP